MNQIEIIQALREACIAAQPLVLILGAWTPRPGLLRKCVAADDLIEHALSLSEDTGKPGREPMPLCEDNPAPEIENY